MKTILVAHSDKTTCREIAEDIKRQIGDGTLRLLLYFASSLIDQQALARELMTAFPGTVTFGCSTAGEIVSGKMQKGSVAAMAFTAPAIDDMAIEIIEDIRDRSREEIVERVKGAAVSLEKHVGTSLNTLDFRTYVGIILIDGMSRAEEKIMDVLGDLTDIIFVGASAGDDCRFSETYVYKNGTVYKNAAVIAVIKPQKGFDFLKTQSFSSTGKKLLASKVEEKTRTVIEFNGKPAVTAYAEALGVATDQVENHFMTNPIGLMIKDEPYVRSPQQVQDESIVFYCNVLEGMELELLASTDIIEDTRKALALKLEETGTISGIVNFHCILRTLELEQKGLMEAYGMIFEKIPTIGFSTYGEEYLGHINQTSTMLIFK